MRDGSAGTRGPGYWAMAVVAAERRSARIVPLYQELYSQEAPDFDSENRQILRAIDKVAQATAERGIWVMDRGGDRRHILLPLLDAGRRFLIRLRGDRHLLVNGEPESAFAIAASCRLPYRERIVRQEPGGEQIWPLRFGACTVYLPERPKIPLTLVVVEGPWAEPMVLLTTLRPGRSRRSHWGLVESYTARWRVEEAIRFVKQSYRLEDIRLLRYERLRTMVTLVTAAAFFAAVVLGKRAKLRLLAEHLLRSSQRIYPSFATTPWPTASSSSSSAPSAAPHRPFSGQETSFCCCRSGEAGKLGKVLVWLTLPTLLASLQPVERPARETNSRGPLHEH